MSFERHEIRELFIPAKWTQHFLQIGQKYQIPWYYLAAIEEAQHDYQKTEQKSIETVAKSLRDALGKKEPTEENLAEIIEQKYPNKSALILAIADSYAWEGAIFSEAYMFPFPKHLRSKVSYSNSWGDPRSFGGKRKHEGIDLFAPKGTPIISIANGKIVRKGWNQLGGWTITIQDDKYPQFFYYYAHLDKYADGLEEGMKVTKAQVLGFVGDSGYGPMGTTGKFPPHLHLGIYVREGYTALQRKAVNPYLFLKLWDPKKEENKNGL